MKPIRRKAAAAAGKSGRGPGTILVLHGPNLNLLGPRGYEYAFAFAVERLGR